MSEAVSPSSNSVGVSVSVETSIFLIFLQCLLKKQEVFVTSRKDPQQDGYQVGRAKVLIESQGGVVRYILPIHRDKPANYN